MSKLNKPRSGSLAYYPRKKAKKETASYKSVKKEDKPVPQVIMGYKVGMLHLIATNVKDKSTTKGRKISIPCTVIEIPDIKIWGLRLLRKGKVITDILAEKQEKELKRKITAFLKKGKKRQKKDTNKKERKIEDYLDKADDIKLLAHTNPKETGIGKKKPDVFEIPIGGTFEEKLKYAKEKLGKKISLEEVLQEKDLIDVKGVTKGKGFQGVVKRFGVKIHRPKAKKRRVVGSISPWHPATIMWTVPRPGQMGYHTRTEYNKQILMLGKKEDVQKINPKGGFKKYGKIKNNFLIVSGSVMGPSKRIIALRKAIRPTKPKIEIDKIDYISTQSEVSK